MIKVSIKLLILLWAVLLYACEETDKTPSVSKPVVAKSVAQDTVVIGNETLITGPLKVYEQGSDVVYKFTVSSALPLSNFKVTTSSDVFSKSSHIVKTIPENAIDGDGNFIQSLSNVVVYYAYTIDQSVPPLSNVTVTFTFQNQNNFVGVSTDKFTVVKKGSSEGKPLKTIFFDPNNLAQGALGVQNNFDPLGANGSKIDGVNGGRLMNRRGPFYSYNMLMDFRFIDDAVSMADQIDLVGYRAKNSVASPLFTKDMFYLVSPSDTTVLTSTYKNMEAIRIYVAGTSGAANINIAGQDYIFMYAPGITLTGTSGTANINFGGTNYLATFASNLNQTATNFVNTYKNVFAALGFTLTSSNAKLIWSPTNKNAAAMAYSITTASGNLAGTINTIENLGQGCVNFVNANKAAFANKGLTLTSSSGATAPQTNQHILTFTAAVDGAGGVSPVITNLTGDINGQDKTDVKNLVLRKTIRQMTASLAARGKSLRKVFFKRLDNLPATDPKRVTPDYFDQMTYDNELNALLDDVVAGGKTSIGPVLLNQVYGFVMDDGRKGLIRTAPLTFINTSGVVTNTVQPNATDWVMFGTIKVQTNP